MRKCYLTFMLFMTHNAFTQITSGTVIIFNFSKNDVVIAADSLAGKDTGPDNSYCKIAAFGHKLLFTSVGNTGWSDATGVVWTNAELAGRAARGSTLDSIVSQWATDVKSHWESINQLDPRRAMEIAGKNKGQITAGVFVGKGLAIKVAVVDYNAQAADPIEMKFGRGEDLHSDCWPCGQLDGRRICAAGSHVDVAANFCSERKHGDSISVRTKLRQADIGTELAVKLAELTIDAYKATGEVGGAVDAVTMNRDGKIYWNALKPNCPSNQE